MLCLFMCSRAQTINLVTFMLTCASTYDDTDTNTICSPIEGPLIRNKIVATALEAFLVATGIFESVVIFYLQQYHSKHLCDEVRHS